MTFFQTRMVPAMGLGLLGLCMLTGCFGRGRDPFTLSDRDINSTDLNPVGEDYAWTSVKLGTYMNGHGLPADRLTFVIVRKRPPAKPELIWPVFAYGQNQANAAVLGDTLVFSASLPDHQVVLIAHHKGGPPLVISPAVLRLAARRLSTSVVIPGADCEFSKVRSPPGRIWLQARAPGEYSFGQKLFSLELTQDDLLKVVEETRQRGHLIKTNHFQYIAEAVSYSHIQPEDVIDAPKSASAETTQAHTIQRSGTTYTPLRDQPHGQGLVDPGSHFAYFSTHHEPSRILKVDLSTKTNGAPHVVGALVLEPEEDNSFNAAIDAEAGYGYFGTDYPGKIVKVALGKDSKPPSRIGSILIDAQYNVGVGAVDPGTGFACFNVGHRLCKVKLREGDESPSVSVSLTLSNEFASMEFASAVVDPINHCVYFGSDYKQILKVDLGTESTPLRIVGVLTLPDDEQGLRGALIDPGSGYAWFTSHSGYIVKIALGGRDRPPIRLGSLKLGQRYQYLEYTFGMDREGYGYYGTMSSETILKIALGKGEELPRLVAALPLPSSPSYIPLFRTGTVDSADRVLCLGVGSIDCVLITLALGEGDSPPRIIGETRLYGR